VISSQVSVFTDGGKPAVKHIEKKYHCSESLLQTFAPQLEEIRSAISSIAWQKEFDLSVDGKFYTHQSAYNKAFDIEFSSRDWESQPRLRSNPRLIGDYRKHLVFVEIQFGNSATLYRDYYKFQYGLANGLLSLAALIVPVAPKEFFPSRPNSVGNMAEFKLANNYLSVLPINVPTILFGLQPENESTDD
jgi:hypothetical protein